MRIDRQKNRLINKDSGKPQVGWGRKRTLKVVNKPVTTKVALMLTKDHSANKKAEIQS